MKKTIAASLITVTCMMNAQSWPNAKPPVAEKQNHIREIHGEKVNDPYYWMIDYFKKGKDSTKVVNYLTAENNYLETMMADTKQLRDQLYQETKPGNSILNIAGRKEAYLHQKRFCWMLTKWRKERPITLQWALIFHRIILK